MGTRGFVSLLNDLEKCKDITPVIKSQKRTLLRYEETNEMLRQFIELSQSTHAMLLENYTTHLRTLLELKKNLESSFRRIRALKGQLKEKYPDAFEATSDAIKELEEKYFQDDEDRLESKPLEQNKEIHNSDGEENQSHETSGSKANKEEDKLNGRSKEIGKSNEFEANLKLDKNNEKFNKESEKLNDCENTDANINNQQDLEIRNT